MSIVCFFQPVSFDPFKTSNFRSESILIIKPSSEDRRLCNPGRLSGQRAGWEAPYCTCCELPFLAIILDQNAGEAVALGEISFRLCMYLGFQVVRGKNLSMGQDGKKDWSPSQCFTRAGCRTYLFSLATGIQRSARIPGRQNATMDG